MNFQNEFQDTSWYAVAFYSAESRDLTHPKFSLEERIAHYVSRQEERCPRFVQKKDVCPGTSSGFVTALKRREAVLPPFQSEQSRFNLPVPYNPPHLSPLIRVKNLPTEIGSRKKPLSCSRTNTFGMRSFKICLANDLISDFSIARLLFSSADDCSSTRVRCEQRYLERNFSTSHITIYLLVLITVHQ